MQNYVDVLLLLYKELFDFLIAAQLTLPRWVFP